MTPGKWRKSTRSGPASNNCVETRTFDTATAPVEVRDSKAPQLGSLAIDRAEFTALLDSVKLSTTCRSGLPRQRRGPLRRISGSWSSAPPSQIE